MNCLKVRKKGIVNDATVCKYTSSGFPELVILNNYHLIALAVDIIPRFFL
jgi:hypothetical protein